jgi:hypothetical protein
MLLLFARAPSVSRAPDSSCSSLSGLRSAVSKLALLAGLAVAALAGCGGNGGGSSTQYDADATTQCLNGLPQTIVAPGEPVSSGELVAVFFQAQTTGVTVFIGQNEEAAKAEYEKRSKFLQNQPGLLAQVLQQRNNALLTWDRPASEKLRNNVLGCLREAPA